MNSNHNIITWQEDVTWDGILDRIEVDLTLANASGENLKGAEETVRIYSGLTGEKIWTGHADTVHAGWNGFYLYRNPENGKAYILNWRPMLYQGEGKFKYQIFPRTDEAKIKVFAEEKFNFNLNTMSKEEREQLENYIARLNGYLQDSYLLIDTDGGEVRYSRAGEPVAKTYSINF